MPSNTNGYRGALESLAAAWHRRGVLRVLQSPVALTPFVPALQARAAETVQRLLALDPGVTVTCAGLPVSAGDWGLVVGVQLPGGPGFSVELRAARPETRGWFRGRAVVMGYRKLRDGRDPLGDPAAAGVLSAVRAAVATLDGDPTAVTALSDAAAELGAYGELEDRVYRYAAPREAVLRLGFRCNQRCGFCWQDRDWPDAPEAYYHAWLDELAAGRPRELTLTGGEPTLHKALVPIVRRAARDHGLAVWVQTNAIRLARPDYLASLVDAGLRGVFVSYHSPVAATSDRMTRAPGTHAVTERGIAACLAAGVGVRLNCVVDRHNHTELPAHAARVVEMFVRPYPANPVSLVVYSHPTGYREEQDYLDALVGLDDVRPYLVAAVRHLDAHAVPVETSDTCGFPPCVFHEAPRFIRLLGAHDPDDRRDRVFGPSCARCAVRDRCIGLRALYVKHLGERGVVPFASSPTVHPMER